MPTSSEALCPDCEELESECTCWTCEDCDARFISSSVRCSNCDSCESCCSCWSCDSCDRLYSGNSSSCCSTCDVCIEHCCYCWSCQGCGARYRRDGDYIQCELCERCNDCCSCPTCEGCGERVDRVCRDCTRCVACECECEGDPCTVCNHRPGLCYCLNCYTIDQETAQITSTHLYNQNSGQPGDRRCTTCGTCATHCRASLCPGCQTGSHNFCTICAKCEGCCVCTFCNRPYIQRHHIPEGLAGVCAGCRWCLAHCTCPKCIACLAKTRRLCQHCTLCESCCKTGECGAFGRNNPIQHVKYPLHTWEPSRKELKRLPNARLIGPEIEVNGISGLSKSKKLWTALNKWLDGVVKDGSIGDLPYAFEINVQPSAGDLFLDHIKELTDGLAMMNASPDQDCGIHIHIDARDFSVYDLNRVISLYAKTERALFDLCHPRRLNHNYCLVSGKWYLENGLKLKPKEFRSRLVSRLYYEDMALKVDPAAWYKRNYRSDNWDTLTPETRKRYAAAALGSMKQQLETEKAHKYRQVRYKALNLHSYFLRKTVEFRHHHGTIDYDSIVGWGQVCQELISCAYRMTQRQIEALPRNSRWNLIALMPPRLHPYIQDSWKKWDAVVAGNSTYKQNRKTIWGI